VAPHLLPHQPKLPVPSKGPPAHPPQPAHANGLDPLHLPLAFVSSLGAQSHPGQPRDFAPLSLSGGADAAFVTARTYGADHPSDSSMISISELNTNTQQHGRQAAGGSSVRIHTEEAEHGRGSSPTSMSSTSTGQLCGGGSSEEHSPDDKRLLGTGANLTERAPSLQAFLLDEFRAQPDGGLAALKGSHLATISKEATSAVLRGLGAVIPITPDQGELPVVGTHLPNAEQEASGRGSVPGEMLAGGTALQHGRPDSTAHSSGDPSARAPPTSGGPQPLSGERTANVQSVRHGPAGIPTLVIPPRSSGGQALSDVGFSPDESPGDLSPPPPFQAAPGKAQPPGVPGSDPAEPPASPHWYPPLSWPSNPSTARSSETGLAEYPGVRFISTNALFVSRPTTAGSEGSVETPMLFLSQKGASNQRGAFAPAEHSSQNLPPLQSGGSLAAPAAPARDHEREVAASAHNVAQVPPNSASASFDLDTLKLPRICVAGGSALSVTSPTAERGPGVPGYVALREPRPVPQLGSATAPHASTPVDRWHAALSQLRQGALRGVSPRGPESCQPLIGQAPSSQARGLVPKAAVPAPDPVQHLGPAR
jgi:hypothetical protein